MLDAAKGYMDAMAKEAEQPQSYDGGPLRFLMRFSCNRRLRLHPTAEVRGNCIIITRALGLVLMFRTRGSTGSAITT